jgi:hypothetical protein
LSRKELIQEGLGAEDVLKSIDQVHFERNSISTIRLGWVVSSINGDQNRQRHRIGGRGSEYKGNCLVDGLMGEVGEEFVSTVNEGN